MSISTLFEIGETVFTEDGMEWIVTGKEITINHTEDKRVLYDFQYKISQTRGFFTHSQTCEESELFKSNKQLINNKIKELEAEIKYLERRKAEFIKQRDEKAEKQNID